MTRKKKKVSDLTLHVDRSDMMRPILIHICKDGTFSYRRTGEKVFNGRALPVYAVFTPEQAESIKIRFCRRMYDPHPDLPAMVPWYKLSVLPDGTDPALSRPEGLLYEDLEGIGVMFKEYYDLHYTKDGALA